MSDAEVKDLNQISKKDIYHTPSGKYIQFIHDHSEKTFDAWELLPDGSHRLLESQSINSPYALALANSREDPFPLTNRLVFSTTSVTA